MPPASFDDKPFSLASKMLFDSIISLAKTTAITVASIAFASSASSESLEIFVKNTNSGYISDSNCEDFSLSTCVSDIDSVFQIVNRADWQRLAAERFDTVRINLEGKTFRLKKPISLNWGTHFESVVPLVISGVGNATVLSGAVQLRHWSHLENDSAYMERISPEIAPNLRLADVSNIGLSLENPVSPYGFGLPIRPVPALLFQGDLSLPLAAWPNSGFSYIALAPDLSPTDKSTFRLGERMGLEWIYETDLMAHGYWYYDWAAQSLPVVVRPDGSFVTDPITPAFGIKPGQRIRIENSLRELDAPGEWFLDRTHGKIIAWLHDDIGEVDLAVSESIFSIQHSRNVIIRDLSMEKTRGDAVRVSHCSNVVLENVSVRHTGNRAVVVKSGKRCGVRGALIEHNGDGGVLLEGGDRKNLVPGENFVETSTIRDFSRRSRTYRFAIELLGVGQRIAENSISEGPHSAIFFDGNDHKILNNEIHNVVKESSDAGAIYVGRDFTSQGTIIEGNFLHHINALDNRREVKGVYLDDQASGIIIRNNIFSHVQQPIFIGGGRDNSITNNIFFNSAPGITLDSRGTRWQKSATLDKSGTLQRKLDSVPIKGNLWRSRYPNLASIRDDDFGHPKYNVACGNIFVYGTPFKISKDAIQGINLENAHIESEDIFRHPPSGRDRRSRSDFELRTNSKLCDYPQGNVTHAK